MKAIVAILLGTASASSIQSKFTTLGPNRQLKSYNLAQLETKAKTFMNVDVSVVEPEKETLTNTINIETKTEETSNEIKKGSAPESQSLINKQAASANAHTQKQLLDDAVSVDININQYIANQGLESMDTGNGFVQKPMPPTALDQKTQQIADKPKEEKPAEKPVEVQKEPE